MLPFLLLIAGFVLLLYGADYLVNGASALAKKFKISELVIGLTIVSFGTSAPELIVNVIAAMNQYHDIVLGNVIGSNIANLFLILGVAGLITPLRVQSSTVWREIPFSLWVAILVFLLGNGFLYGHHPLLYRTDGIILLVFFALFLGYIAWNMIQDKSAAEHIEEEIMDLSNVKIFVFILGGLAALILGGKLVVDNAVMIAQNLGVSEKLIGLTIVSIGTSLPELATSAVAAYRGKDDLAVGNVIGSNIFNLLLILGVSVIVAPLKYNVSFNFDLTILAAGTIFLFVAMFLGKQRHQLSRLEAGILLVSYFTYTAYLIMRN
ncbi:MAG: calcium/sodium antiporter [Chitinophagales bacterium]|nr:calcium/sodium antiporter [Bacteroidota bacterium]MCB9042272.1 calcium/sodium antiporter [Chitinophagales bacterium]